jgi:hypothetical protein
MTINMAGMTPLYEAPGDPSGGGTSNAPLGAEPVQSTPSEPQALELSDDSLIRVKGSDKPVKFSDHVKGFQSQFTKASQRAAQLEKALQERDARLKALEQAQQASAANRGGTQSTEDVFAALRALPYLKGEDAVNIVEGIGEQIRQRDMILVAALKQLQQMKGIVDGLHSNYTQTSHDAKLKGWLSDWGYPQEAFEMAKTVYAAYEGDDLDDEFQNIFNQHWTLAEKLVEARRQQKVAQARKVPFIPGRGGDAKPSKPLEMKPTASSKDVAEELFRAFAENET